jgi:hypothetical protein
MSIKLAVPSYKINHETQEVTIPYDQFHTWLTEIIDRLESVQEIVEATKIDSYIKQTDGRIQALKKQKELDKPVT